MSRFVLFIFLNFILILEIEFGLCQSNDTSTVCDCNCYCNVQLDVTDEDLYEDEGISEDKIDALSKENQLIANRVTKPTNCMEAAANSFKSGIYKIYVEITDLEVFCEEGVGLGGWLVIQRRQSGTVNFTRDWHDYKEGFGDLIGNYWIGLEKIHALTNSCEQELYIQLHRSSGEKYYAKYSEFLIGDESESYALKKLGDYSGNAGDSLSYHLGMKFSTYDRDNDIYKDNCAMIWKGGWWFSNCHISHLNGPYGNDSNGGIWIDKLHGYNLTFAQMMIRPTQNCWRQLMLNNLN